MSQRLLRAKKAAQILGISLDEVEMLVRKGLIPAYRIGGVFLRFRKEQIQELKGRRFSPPEQVSPDAKGGVSESKESASKTAPESQSQAFPSPLGEEGWPACRTGRGEGPGVKYTVFERAADFLYYNDFYIISTLIIIGILFFIFTVR